MIDTERKKFQHDANILFESIKKEDEICKLKEKKKLEEWKKGLDKQVQEKKSYINNNNHMNQTERLINAEFLRKFRTKSVC